MHCIISRINSFSNFLFPNQEQNRLQHILSPIFAHLGVILLGATLGAGIGAVAGIPGILVGALSGSIVGLAIASVKYFLEYRKRIIEKATDLLKNMNETRATLNTAKELEDNTQQTWLAAVEELYKFSQSAITPFYDEEQLKKTPDIQAAEKETAEAVRTLSNKGILLDEAKKTLQESLTKLRDLLNQLSFAKKDLEKHLALLKKHPMNPLHLRNVSRATETLRGPVANMQQQKISVENAKKALEAVIQETKEAIVALKKKRSFEVFLKKLSESLPPPPSEDPLPSLPDPPNNPILPPVT